MKKYYLLFFAIIPFIFSCSDNIVSPEPPYDSSINGKSIRIYKNQQFILELEVCLDGGYCWDCSFSDNSILRIDSTKFRSKNGNPNLVGGMSIETFYFCGIKKGKCWVDLYERQPWEPGTAPINTIQFNVIVN